MVGLGQQASKHSPWVSDLNRPGVYIRLTFASATQPTQHTL